MARPSASRTSSMTGTSTAAVVAFSSTRVRRPCWARRRPTAPRGRPLPQPAGAQPVWGQKAPPRLGDSICPRAPYHARADEAGKVREGLLDGGALQRARLAGEDSRRLGGRLQPITDGDLL